MAAILAKRFFLAVEYFGPSFCGLSRAIAPTESGLVGVQNALEDALTCVTGRPTLTVSSSRTDSGVHATYNVLHTDVLFEKKALSAQTLAMATNFYLRRARQNVRVLKCAPVSRDFHARFSAIRRTYCYRLSTSSVEERDSMHEGKMSWILPMARGRDIDLEKMKEAAQQFMGEHNFSGFIKGEHEQPVRCLDAFEVKEVERPFHLRRPFEDPSRRCFEIWVKGRSFMHNQVRIMVSSLVEVGMGRWDAAVIPGVLSGKITRPTVKVSPAHGLYLCNVEYPPECLHMDEDDSA